MAVPPLTQDAEFTVGEEKVLDFILAGLFFSIFLFGFIDTVFFHLTELYIQGYLFMITLLPAVIAFKKGLSKRIYLRINKTGIYQDEQLVARWDKMLKAYITQKEVLGSWRDNFLLVLHYKKENRSGWFRRKVPLTNSQNKSEEEIIAAIRFFWKLHKSTPPPDDFQVAQ